MGLSEEYIMSVDFSEYAYPVICLVVFEWTIENLSA
jgi:hypothetical protein